MLQSRGKTAPVIIDNRYNRCLDNLKHLSSQSSIIFRFGSEFSLPFSEPLFKKSPVDGCRSIICVDSVEQKFMGLFSHTA